VALIQNSDPRKDDYARLSPCCLLTDQAVAGAADSERAELVVWSETAFVPKSGAGVERTLSGSL
jgi:hypothetical protein